MNVKPHRFFVDYLYVSRQASDLNFLGSLLHNLLLIIFILRHEITHFFSLSQLFDSFQLSLQIPGFHSKLRFSFGHIFALRDDFKLILVRVASYFRLLLLKIKFFFFIVAYSHSTQRIIWLNFGDILIFVCLLKVIRIYRFLGFVLVARYIVWLLRLFNVFLVFLFLIFFLLLVFFLCLLVIP